MVAALLHDIGKGSLTEHSVAGEPIARAHRDPDGLRRGRRGPDRAAGALAPAARRDRDHPRPRRPGDGRARWPRRLGTAEALDLLHRAHRGRRARRLAQGLVVLAVRADPRPVPPHQGRARPAARALPPVCQRRGRGAQRRCAAAGSSISVEPVADGTPGDRDRPGPGRAARRRRRDVRAAADRECGRRGPGRRTSSASRSGRSPRSTSTRRCCASATTAIQEGRLDPAPAAGAAGHVRCWRRPSSYAPRRRRRRPCSRCGPPTGPGVVYLVCAALARARRRGPLGARRHARAAGRRRVLPPGGLGRGAQRPAGRRGGPRRPRRR